MTKQEKQAILVSAATMVLSAAEAGESVEAQEQIIKEAIKKVKDDSRL